jgi:hypothetical protein
MKGKHGFVFPHCVTLTAVRCVNISEVEADLEKDKPNL